MWRVVRLAMMWLLAVALPLQGTAATFMIGCGPDHGAPEQSSLSAGEHHVRPKADHAEPAVETGAHEQIEHRNSSDGDSSPGKGFGHKCSACASCCVGAAIPSQVITFNSVNPTELFAPLGSSSVAAFLSEGLERPPRPFLA